MNDEFGTRQKKLDAEQRVKLLAPPETLARLGYRGGVLADIGCGTGLFTIPAAKIASPQAKVYAVDISQQMLESVNKRAESEKICNIIAVESGEYDFGLGDETADFVLMCTVLHEVEDKLRFLREAKRVCRQGGRLAVIEFSGSQMGFGPPLGERISEDQVESLLKSSGFSNISSAVISEAFYAVTAEKPR